MAIAKIAKLFPVQFDALLNLVVVNFVRYLADNIISFNHNFFI